MARSTMNSDLFVAGNLTSQTMTIPSNTVKNADVKSDAGIRASKLEHQHQKHFCQDHGTASTAQRRVIHTVKGLTGTLVDFRAGLVVAITGDSTTTVDLYKNGSTILSSTVELDNSNSAFALEQASGFSSTVLAADDVLEVVVTVAANTGTLGQGLFCELDLREDAA